MSSYLHHVEYELNPLGEKKISELIKEKRAVYNLKVDSKKNKFDKSLKLKKLDINLLPRYVKDNLKKFDDWIEKWKMVISCVSMKVLEITML